MITEFLINSLADRIGEDFIAGKGKSLSNLVAEASKVNRFNDESIKRLIEAVNVAVFKKLFELKGAKGDKDRNVEFDVADFSKVKEILDDIEESSESLSDSQEESLSPSDIEKKYPDLRNNPLSTIMSNFPLFNTPGVKHVQIRIEAVKKASEDLGALFEKTRHDYIQTINELATEFSRYNAYDLNKFASDVIAVSESKKEAGEVLLDIYNLCKEKPSNIKISEDPYIQLPKKEYDLFKKAMDLFKKLEYIESKINETNKVINEWQK